jgi:lipopolysaccharide/colanic/teichoic acid biosynthesis glycosyltransferase
MPEPVTLLGVAGGMLGLVWHLGRHYFEMAKETVDILLGVLLLLIALPVMALCALLIRLSGPGPIGFTQVRVGKDGRPFRMYKLRTMVPDSESRTGAVWASQNDSRVIPACRWMRRCHVDELPQLINVIKGDMSLVGPRPERLEILAKLKERYPDVERRLAVRPGITGLAQIRNGYDTSVEAFRYKLVADLEYIEKRRWGLDLSILARTLAKLNDKGAH